MTDTRRLPSPHTAIWDWQLRAACRRMDSEIFFHPDDERGPSRARREAQAKAVCRPCPVIRQCRAHALAVREPYGIWGGLSRLDRDLITGPANTLAPEQPTGSAELTLMVMHDDLVLTTAGIPGTTTPDQGANHG
jgi:WhiB family redox-sensing transcriptional regulator